MDYTHYWYRPKRIDRKTMQAIADHFSKIVLTLDSMGVKLAEGFGENVPEIIVAEIPCQGANEADLLLIAAAPELLEALREMVRIRSKQWHDAAEVASIKGQVLLPWPELQQAEAALAKAEGKVAP